MFACWILNKMFHSIQSLALGCSVWCVQQFVFVHLYLCIYVCVYCKLVYTVGPLHLQCLCKPYQYMWLCPIVYVMCMLIYVRGNVHICVPRVERWLLCRSLVWGVRVYSVCRPDVFICVDLVYCACLSQLSADIAKVICSTLYANFCLWACSSCSSASMIWNTKPHVSYVI